MRKTNEMQKYLFFQENEQVRHLYRAIDCLNNLYGPNTIAKAAIHESVNR